MIKEQPELNDVGRGLEFALMMQKCWAKEIDHAVKAVKRGVPYSKGGKYRRKRKRGYWSPGGFVWFKGKKGRENRFDQRRCRTWSKYKKGRTKLRWSKVGSPWGEQTNNKQVELGGVEHER